MTAAARWREWWAEVSAGLDAGAAPGGACWVAVDGAVLIHACHGYAKREPDSTPLRRGMWFDLASVTKAVSTTTCVMTLVEDHRLDLDQPAAEHLPELAEHGKTTVTPRQLLTHTSGLPAWVRFYETCPSRDEVRRQVLATPLEADPGAATCYSDVGFLTLGFLIEAVTGLRQDRFLEQEVLTPAGLRGLGYRPKDPQLCVATERCVLRGTVVQGEVHDENAWRCDGVAGHAGLFGTVAGVGQFGQALLDGSLLGEAAMREVFRVRADPAADRFWLGWKRLAYESDDPIAYGHDGFTGTLLWISPRRRLVLALLTNRVHPTRDNRRLYELRPEWVRKAVALVDRGG